MPIVRLDEFIKRPRTEKSIRKNIARNMLTLPSRGKKFSRKKNNERKELFPDNLPPSYLISATYDGDSHKALLKLYEPNTQRIYYWLDTKAHMPYCLTNISSQDLEKFSRLISLPGFDHFEEVRKYDALLNRDRVVTKVVAKDPLSIGGRSSKSIRDIIPQDSAGILGEDFEVKVWESSIKYYQCYINDEGLSPGMLYEIKDGELISVKFRETEENITRILEKNFKGEKKDFLSYLESWIRLLEYPAPEMKRVALDIEVFSPIPTRVPNADEAEYPIICVSLAGSDGRKRVLILKREDKNFSEEINIQKDVTLEFYRTELELCNSLFKAIEEFPFILTFNGDEFDLRYIYQRALRLGFNEENIPLEPRQRVFFYKNGIHIDLYRFFFNRSIQIYAFSQKYRNVTLNEVSMAILGKTKTNISETISELSYTDLAKYCLNDAELTLELTEYNDDLVMKLVLVLARISRMPIEDVSRQGVSRWIRSFMQFEHRRRNILIPNRDDIIALKGDTATTAIIKGKKYKGAIVVEPLPGVHFNVDVMDFQSLYPSIMKIYNLGYQSIRCQHEECKNNKVPGTPHWICTKTQALESALIGSLRDLRIRWYKPRAKDFSLSKEQRNWYNVIQAAVKVILNASYGVFGAESFDLYCPPVAEATAALGRNIITQTIEKAQELGIKVIYGDTDSIFLKNPSSEQIKSLSEWSQAFLGLELEVEKSYRYAVLSSRKKNYLGVLDDGKVDVKGLTGKKRHIPKLIKRFFDSMEKLLSEVRNPADFDTTKRKIESVVRNCYSILKNRKWDSLDDLAFEVVLGKAPSAYTKTTPQHVKAARLLEKEGFEIQKGDLIRFVKVLKDPFVKPIELAVNNEIDTEKYIAYLQSTFDQILDALGLEFEKITGLTRLEMFM